MIKQMNKKAGFTDIFLFMIFSVIIVFVLGIMIFIVSNVNDKLHNTMDGMDIGGNKNTTEIINESIGVVNSSYQAFYWIAILLIGGMIVAIFIGSYLVTTKPIFLIPYIFVVIIAIIVSVGIANACEQVFADPTLESTFSNFLGAKWLLLNLPIIISIVGVVGGIIMFALSGSRQEESYYGY